MPYRGRFAPSPTGPLHFGSLVAAVASFCEARHRGGEWLVRMEDVDEPRTVAASADGILATLEAFGLEWDGEVLYQSRRKARYREVLDDLKRNGAVYPCACSRKQVCHCRGGLPPGRAPRVWRVLSNGEPVRWTDRALGEQQGFADDFVVLRADGYFAYQLAVVVDDAEQGITGVVRGADLLESTPRQIYLQRLLGYPTPEYLHAKLALDTEGQKLSKQTRAPAVKADAEELRRVLAFLDQPKPEGETMAELLSSAIRRWEYPPSHFAFPEAPAHGS